MTFESTVACSHMLNLSCVFREWAMAMTTMQMLIDLLYFFSLLIVFGK